MWLARNKNGELYIYYEEPTRNEYLGVFQYLGWYDIVESLSLPFEVTWENSPIEVNINITKKE